MPNSKIVMRPDSDGAATAEGALAMAAEALPGVTLGAAFAVPGAVAVVPTGASVATVGMAVGRVVGDGAAVGALPKSPRLPSVGKAIGASAVNWRTFV